jgi:hypothetical protein
VTLSRGTEGQERHDPVDFFKIRIFSSLDPERNRLDPEQANGPSGDIPHSVPKIPMVRDPVGFDISRWWPYGKMIVRLENGV